MSQVPQVTSEKIRKALFIRPGVRLPSGSKAESLVLILEPYDQANILLSMQARQNFKHLPQWLPIVVRLPLTRLQLLPANPAMGVKARRSSFLFDMGRTIDGKPSLGRDRLNPGRVSHPKQTPKDLIVSAQIHKIQVDHCFPGLIINQFSPTFDPPHHIRSHNTPFFSADQSLLLRTLI